MTPKQKMIWDLRQKGRKFTDIASEVGLSVGTVHYHYSNATKFLDTDQGIVDALTESGLSDIGKLHSGWLKTDNASLYFVQPKDAPVEALEGTLEYIKSRVEGITPLEPISAPNSTVSDLMTVYPIADAHIGMRAVRDEAGDDYDLNIAKTRIRSAMDELTAAAPASSHAVIIDVGDLTHADDKNYVTPRSKHTLDMGATQYESLDAAIEILSSAIFAALRRHETVTVRILRGNHNENSYIAVMFALFERFRDNDRVTIEKTPADFFVHQWGKVMIAAHHGDKAKAERLVMHMAHEWPEMWGATKWRHYFTGHLHHTLMRDIGGVRVEQLRAATNRDQYAASHGYVAAPQMQAITFHKETGEKSRAIVNF